MGGGAGWAVCLALGRLASRTYFRSGATVSWESGIGSGNETRYITRVYYIIHSLVTQLAVYTRYRLVSFLDLFLLTLYTVSRERGLGTSLGIYIYTSSILVTLLSGTMNNTENKVLPTISIQRYQVVIGCLILKCSYKNDKA